MIISGSTIFLLLFFYFLPLLYEENPKLYNLTLKKKSKRIGFLFFFFFTISSASICSCSFFPREKSCLDYISYLFLGKKPLVLIKLLI